MGSLMCRRLRAARPLVPMLFAGLTLLGIGPLSTGEGIAYVDGPPLRSAGGFGDETCHKCHFENDLNDPVGSLGLDGVPENYVSGEQYVIQIVIERPEIRRGGFQLAARFANGDRAGEQAGSLVPLDERVEVATEENTQVQYARQTLSGSLPGPEDTAGWSVRWTAPEDAAGAIRFNLAGNASNYDASEFGDFVYTEEALSRPPRLQTSQPQVGVPSVISKRITLQR